VQFGSDGVAGGEDSGRAVAAIKIEEIDGLFELRIAQGPSDLLWANRPLTVFGKSTNIVLSQ
jgi:hypothetical protein